MKRLLIALMLVFLFAVAAQAQTETGSKALFYGGAKVLVGDPEGGKGAFLAVGYVINENFVFLGKYDAENNPEVDIDELKGCLAVITEPLIGESAGLFFRGDIGGAYVQPKTGSGVGENDWQFATFTDAGIYVDLDSKKTTRLWMGIGYHNIDTVKPIYSLNVGVSIIPKTWLW